MRALHADSLSLASKFVSRWLLSVMMEDEGNAQHDTSCVVGLGQLEHTCGGYGE